MKTTAPKILANWKNQGGAYAGVMPATGDQPAYRMVLGEKLPGARWADLFGPAGLADNLPKAKEVAAAYSSGGHEDFYLPSIEELRQIYENVGDSIGGWCWSSTEASEGEAFFFGFSDGLVHQTSKAYPWPVIPVRKVPVE